MEGLKGAADPPQLRIGSVSYHSTYDPVKEASRFIDALPPFSGTIALVIGEGLGYFAREIAQRRPQIRVACAYISPLARSLSLFNAWKSWDPQDSLSWEAFLASLVPRELIDEISPIFCPAMARLLPDLSQRLEKGFLGFFRQEQGSLLTQSYFGQRWLRNAFRHLQTSSPPLKLQRGEGAIVVAAAGPTLQNCRHLLLQKRHEITLWALSSALTPLLAWGITPDLVIATDGGYWARDHLKALSGTEIPLATPLFAAFESDDPKRPTLYFSQKWSSEQDLLQHLLQNFLTIPTRGTVGITAVQLALLATSGDVFVAGMDQCYQGLRGHARPHSTDTLLELNSHRLHPYENIISQRTWDLATIRLEDGSKTSAAMLTYARWLDQDPQIFENRVFRLCPSALQWASMPAISDADFLRSEAKAPPQLIPMAPLLQTEPRRLCHQIIRQWIALLPPEAPQEEAVPWSELAALLTPQAKRQWMKALCHGGDAALAWQNLKTELTVKLESFLL